MIDSWRYDPGDPHYMEAIGEWTERSRPRWSAMIYPRNNQPDFEKWFESQGAVDEIDYDCHFRFNSASPAYFIHIYREDLAAAFLLRFSNDR